MKILLVVIFCATVASAQPRTSFSGSFAAVGTPASVNLNMIGGGMNPTAFQVSFAVPTGAVITQGPGLTAAGKSLSFVVNAAGVATLMVIGGTGTVPDGVMATVTFTSAPFQFSPTGAIAVDQNGGVVGFSAGGFNFGSSCDLNGDGKIDQLDITASIDQAIGRTACVSADLNGDGKCNVIDAQRIVIAANGGACKVIP